MMKRKSDNSKSVFGEDLPSKKMKQSSLGFKNHSSHKCRMKENEKDGRKFPILSSTSDRKGVGVLNPKPNVGQLPSNQEEGPQHQKRSTPKKYEVKRCKAAPEKLLNSPNLRKMQEDILAGQQKRQQLLNVRREEAPIGRFNRKQSTPKKYEVQRRKATPEKLPKSLRRKMQEDILARQQRRQHLLKARREEKGSFDQKQDPHRRKDSTPKKYEVQRRKSTLEKLQRSPRKKMQEDFLVKQQRMQHLLKVRREEIKSAKHDIKKQLTQALLTVSLAKPAVAIEPFLPSKHCGEFIQAIGIEEINKVTEVMKSKKKNPEPFVLSLQPYLCCYCHTDFSPVWKAIVGSRRVSCWNCHKSTLKTKWSRNRSAYFRRIVENAKQKQVQVEANILQNHRLSDKISFYERCASTAIAGMTRKLEKGEETSASKLQRLIHEEVKKSSADATAVLNPKESSFKQAKMAPNRSSQMKSAFDREEEIKRKMAIIKTRSFHERGQSSSSEEDAIVLKQKKPSNFSLDGFAKADIRSFFKKKGPSQDRRQVGRDAARTNYASS